MKGVSAERLTLLGSLVVMADGVAGAIFEIIRLKTLDGAGS